MKKIIRDSLKFIAVFAFISLFQSQAFAVDTTASLSLYGSPKYKSGFKSFEYVNPDAPKGGKIVHPNYGGFDNFNPFIFKGSAPGIVSSLTLDTLAVVPIDDISTAYPLIAKKFELPKDKSFVGFILDKRAKFSDGTPVTADDVIFSFNALTEKGSPIYRVYYGDVERVEKLSDYHFRFHFKKDSNNKELPLILAQLPVFSAKYWENRDFSQPKLEAYLGSGPYQVAKFDAGKYIVLKRRPDYWAKDLPTRKGHYNFDEVRVEYYQDTTVTLQALFSGNIDVREEYIAKIWATGYDNDIIKQGKVIKDEIYHNNPAILQHFAFNIRKGKFQDKRVREAINLAFNFDWANEKLFYNQYNRIFSYFANTGMEAVEKPEGLELKKLQKYKNKLPTEVFAEVPTNPVHSDNPATRKHLKQAVKLLQEAGYDFKDGRMVNVQTNEPLEIEVISNSANGSTFVRVMLPFIDNLKKIGVKANFRTLENNVFKNRLDAGDFDMAIVSFRMSQMPGNELKDLWGSAAADVKGSLNYIGIKNEVVDSLINDVITSDKKEDYIANVKALDRVLRHEHYMIFQWYTPFNRVAYWDKFGIPKSEIKTGFQPDLWWAKEKENKK